MGIDQMSAGRELDAMVAERVMSWRRFPYVMPNGTGEGEIVYCPPGRVHVSTTAPVPPYSSEISAAWQVLERMREHIGTDLWYDFTQEINVACSFKVSAALADLTPLLICRAALSAVAAGKAKATY